MPPSAKVALFRDQMRSYDEIAALTGVTPKTVRIRLKEGRSLELPGRAEQYRLAREAKAARDSDPANVEASRVRHRKARRRAYEKSRRMGMTMDIAYVRILNEVLAAFESGRSIDVRDRVMRDPGYSLTRALLLRAEIRMRGKLAKRLASSSVQERGAEPAQEAL